MASFTAAPTLSRGNKNLTAVSSTTATAISGSLSKEGQVGERQGKRVAQASCPGRCHTQGQQRNSASSGPEHSSSVYSQPPMGPQCPILKWGQAAVRVRSHVALGVVEFYAWEWFGKVTPPQGPLEAS